MQATQPAPFAVSNPAVAEAAGLRYVHPAILDGYLSGQTIATLQQSADQRLRGALAKLKPEEAAVMMLLRERLAQAGRAGGAQRALTLTRKRHARRQ